MHESTPSPPTAQPHAGAVTAPSEQAQGLETSIESRPTDGRLRPPLPRSQGGRGALHNLWHHLLREHRQPTSMGVAVFVGIVIGATPLYGFHLLLCLAAATLFRLNKLTVYLVANISNPLVAPLLLAVEVMIGEWILHGTVLWLDPSNIQSLGLGTVAYRFFVSALVGSLAVGVGLGAPLGLATTLWLRRKRSEAEASDGSSLSPEDELLRDDERFRASTRAVAEALRLAALERGESHFRRTFLVQYTTAKISMDPVYRNLVSLLPQAGTVIDIGTGFGFLPLLLGELYPKRSGQVLGFDYDQGKVETGQAAAAVLATSNVQLEVGDAVDRAPGTAAAICLIDVLHYLDQEKQRSLVVRCVEALSPGGILVIRDMPLKGGLGALVTRYGERFAMWVGLNRGERVTPVDSDQLHAAMESMGLLVTEHAMATGPLADRLWVGSVPDDSGGAATHSGPSQQIHGVQDGDS